MYRRYVRVHVRMYVYMYIYQVLHGAVKTRKEVVEGLRQLHRCHLLRQLSERADVELQHLCVCVCVRVRVCVFIHGNFLRQLIKRDVYTHAYVYT